MVRTRGPRSGDAGGPQASGPTAAPGPPGPAGDSWGTTADLAAVEHRVTLAEVGPFCAARCACGWRGPGRRARSLARTDAAGHREDPESTVRRLDDDPSAGR